MFSKYIEVHGSGQELIIGSISNSIAERIASGQECITHLFNKPLEDVDDVLHLCGPEMSAVGFIDQRGNFLVPDNFVINYEPCWESVDRLRLLDELGNYSYKNLNAEHFVDDLLSRNYFSNRSDSTFYLIQNHSERGYWGKIDLSRSDDLSSIYTLSAEMEGMGELSLNMLLGFLIKEDKKYCFNEVIADGSTEVHSRQYYLFSKDKGIIWHG